MNTKVKYLVITILLLVVAATTTYVSIKVNDVSVLIVVTAVNLLLLSFVFHAIYQSKKTKIILQNQKDKLQEILEAVPVPIFITDKQRKITFINEKALKLFNCSKTAENMIGKPCCSLKTCVCNTPECSIEKAEQTGVDRAYYTFEDRNYMVNTSIVKNKDENLKRYIEVIEDITDVVNVKNALNDKTVELETMSENIVGGVLITKMEDGYEVIRCNKGYCEMTGRKEEQIVGFSAMQWVNANDAVILDNKIKAQLKEGNCISLEHRLISYNGEQLWVLLRGKCTEMHHKKVGVWILTDINKAKNTELALKIDDERYKIAMQSTGDIIIDYDMKTHIMYHSLKAKEIYGVPEFIENMPQSILDKGVVLSETKDEYLDLFRQLSNGVKKCSAVIKTRGIDGSILWNMLSFTSIFDDEGNVARAIGVLQDITREKSIEILQKRDERYLEISGSEGTSYYEVDLTNRCFIYGPENIMKTNSSTNDFNTVLKAIISENIYADDCEFVFENSRIEMLVNNYNSGISHTTIEFRKIFKDSIIWVECSMQCFVDDTTGDLHCVGSIRNINEMKVKELLLKEKAERDLLTGLYNKITTEFLIKNLTDFAEKDEVSGALLVIDLDNFKNINDTYGHISGDEVLVKVAKKLITIFRDGDIVGRIGGDEFVVYMNHVDSPIIVGKKAMQVCDMFRKIEISGALDCRIKGSVGISIFPTYGKNFEELYKNADKALYVAKRQGKDKYIQYTENL